MHNSVFILENLLRNNGPASGLSGALLQARARSYFVLSPVSFKRFVKVEKQSL